MTHELKNFHRTQKHVPSNFNRLHVMTQFKRSLEFMCHDIESSTNSMIYFTKTKKLILSELQSLNLCEKVIIVINVSGHILELDE